MVKLLIPYSPEFSFCDFMAKPTQVRDWNIQGLPSDTFSTENGVITTSGKRWPLMIDPQGEKLWIEILDSIPVWTYL